MRIIIIYVILHVNGTLALPFGVGCGDKLIDACARRSRRAHCTFGSDKFMFYVALILENERNHGQNDTMPTLNDPNELHAACRAYLILVLIIAIKHNHFIERQSVNDSSHVAQVCDWQFSDILLSKKKKTKKEDEEDTVCDAQLFSFISIYFSCFVSTCGRVVNGNVSQFRKRLFKVTHQLNSSVNFVYDKSIALR